MHMDPSVKVLATTTCSGEHDAWIDGCVMPVVWKKVFAKGRIFYTTLGNGADDFKVPQTLKIIQRDIFWASENKYEETPNLVSPVYPRR